MVDIKEWFEIIKHKDYLYVIREKLDEVDPRFKTNYTNIFLLLGSHSALLIDTGCGLFPLKSIVNELKGNRKLLVFNTHSHWDHVGGNAEFGEIFIHTKELSKARRSRNLFLLKSSPKEIAKNYKEIKYHLPPAEIVNPLNDGDKFDLGDLSVEIIHTPGHSRGSISILTNRGELFTGDTAHYGTMYLPSKRHFPEFLKIISKLMEPFETNPNIEIYPSHEDYPVGKELLQDLYQEVNNIDDFWEKKNFYPFIFGWFLEGDSFKYIIRMFILKAIMLKLKYILGKKF